MSARLSRARRWVAFLCEHPAALAAHLRWPVFSSDSFDLVSSIARQGIRPSTVIDVGANVGQFSVAAARLLGPSMVYAFEPLPQCVEALGRNLRGPRVNIVACALGAEEGEVQMHVTRGSFASSCLATVPDFQTASPDNQEVALLKVRASTLDRELGEADMEAPVLLKLDTQGYEANVIRGAQRLLPRVDWLVVELGFKVRYQGETLFPGVLALLETMRFQFVRPLAWHRDEATAEITEMDALFVNRSRCHQSAMTPGPGAARL